jgi:hypothetical protein
MENCVAFQQTTKISPHTYGPATEKVSAINSIIKQKREYYRPTNRSQEYSNQNQANRAVLWPHSEYSATPS